MTTPKFTLSQEPDTITINIQIPFVKNDDLDYLITEKEFYLKVTPYYLKLEFPSEISNSNEQITYDEKTESVNVLLHKQTKGKYFENLEQLKAKTEEINITDSQKDFNFTKNQLPKEKKVKKEEEKEKEKATKKENEKENEKEKEKEKEKEEGGINSLVQKVDKLKIKEKTYRYGFNDLYTNAFELFHSVLDQIIEIPDPKNVSPKERSKRSFTILENKFDPEHYMADYAMEDNLIDYIEYLPFWYPKQEEKKENKQKTFALSEKEQKSLSKLPTKKYNIIQQHTTLLGLVDLLFCYSYDNRINLGDDNPESSWTISKLSPTLSCLENFTSLKELLIKCIKRSISYPLYRNWKLSEKIIQDVKQIIKSGKMMIVKCLLDLKNIFDLTTNRYIFSKIFINDYCTWVNQLENEDLFQNILEELNELKLNQNDIGWKLNKLEEIVKIVKLEQKNNNK
ncbi:hypothetical protein M0812_04027 [Anaeramoeba flamelloides]|uniref:CS domain-containing protein n=1 Tax=Anaeramoeba flamelloides TaxID=1746091 RepID=A0AAV8AEE3_9EUKA|nr:hypothetical protein M0812_04027 [Anaeramoeba flamelloides]